MNILNKQLSIKTSGKGTYEITSEVNSFISQSNITLGQITIFIQHTSASLVIMENADIEARTDLHAFFENLVPENLPYLIHTYEGPDDSTSHIRMALTRTSETIPICDGKVSLGTWQGIFIFEHRNSSYNRNIVLSIIGNN